VRVQHHRTRCQDVQDNDGCQNQDMAGTPPVRQNNNAAAAAGLIITKKPLQGGSGLVQGVRFSNIQVTEVQTPIMIDQFYCDRATCRNQTSAVAVSGVQYEDVRGTFTVRPAHLACSDSSPCSGITLAGIQLQPLPLPQHRRLSYDPFCWQAFGELYTPTVPPIPCLQIGRPAAGNSVLSDGDLC
jgi:hypothetical protein